MRRPRLAAAAPVLRVHRMVSERGRSPVEEMLGAEKARLAKPGGKHGRIGQQVVHRCERERARNLAPFEMVNDAV